jgi:D-3-phosphoglycerate dehydrogenase
VKIMYRILTLNKISPAGLDILDRQKYAWGEEEARPDGVLVRSAAMHDMEFPDSLRAIARAGAGVNNIPIDLCSQKGIAVFNTPGANANAVKELTLLGLLLSARKVWPGMRWVQTLAGQEGVAKLVEKGKSQFVGPEIAGKKLGVIGLGAIGILVANAAVGLGMEVYGYDPYLSVAAAWKLDRSVRHAATLGEIYQNCDFITLHLPLNDSTRGMINSQAMASMKHGVRILNFSRGELVQDADMLEALAERQVRCYVTDFPNEALVGNEGVLALPHLGASTPESEDNCARMAAQELMDYLENGNIQNSVNLPDLAMPRTAGTRICVIHKNVPAMISGISGVLADAGLNIDNLTNKSKKEMAYTMMDVDGPAADAVAEAIKKLDGVIRVTLYR